MTPLFLEGKSQEELNTSASVSPMERLGTPEDIAEVVAFLAGPQGRWVKRAGHPRQRRSDLMPEDESKVVVTGVSSGFGALSVRALGKSGHTVNARMRGTADHNTSAMDDLESDAKSTGADLRTVEIDVSHQESALRRQRAVDRVVLPSDTEALQLLCPNCAAKPEMMCRDTRSQARRKPAAAAIHMARYWRQRRCPACRAMPGEPHSQRSRGRRGAHGPSKPHPAGVREAPAAPLTGLS